MTEPTAIIRLDTSETRPTVRIDAVDYEMRVQADLVLRDFRLIHRQGARVVALEQQDELSTEEQREYSALLASLARVALDAPDAVIDALSELQKSAVVGSFLVRLLPVVHELMRGSQPTTMTMPPAPPVTTLGAPSPSAGKSASPGSRGSTGSTRRTSTRGSQSG